MSGRAKAGKARDQAPAKDVQFEGMDQRAARRRQTIGEWFASDQAGFEIALREVLGRLPFASLHDFAIGQAKEVERLSVDHSVELVRRVHAEGSVVIEATLLQFAVGLSLDAVRLSLALTAELGRRVRATAGMVNTAIIVGMAADVEERTAKLFPDTRSPEEPRQRGDHRGGAFDNMRESLLSGERGTAEKSRHVVDAVSLLANHFENNGAAALLRAIAQAERDRRSNDRLKYSKQDRAAWREYADRLRPLKKGKLIPQVAQHFGLPETSHESIRKELLKKSPPTR